MKDSTPEGRPGISGPMSKSYSISFSFTAEELQSLREAASNNPDGLTIQLTIDDERFDKFARQVDRQRPDVSYSEARGHLLRVIHGCHLGDLTDAKNAGRALFFLERAREVEIERDTPEAFIEHATRMFEDDHDVMSLVREAKSRWEDEDDDDDDD